MNLIQFINIGDKPIVPRQVTPPPRQATPPVPRQVTPPPRQATPPVPRQVTPPPRQATPPVPRQAIQATKKPQIKFNDNILEEKNLKATLKAGILQTTADGGIPLTNITGICYTLAAYNFIARLRYLLVTEVTTLINHEEIKEIANKKARELNSIQIDNYNKYLVLQSFAELMNKNMFTNYSTDRIHFIRNRLSQLKFSAYEYSYLNKYLTDTFDDVINIANTVYDNLPTHVKNEIRDSTGEKDELINLELVKKTQRINYNNEVAKLRNTQLNANAKYNKVINAKGIEFDNDHTRRSEIIRHLNISSFTDTDCVYFFNYIKEMTRPGYLGLQSYAEEEKEKLFIDSTYIMPDTLNFNDDRYKFVLKEYKYKIELLMKYCISKQVAIDFVLCDKIISVINHYLTTKKFKVDVNTSTTKFFDTKVYKQIFSLSSNTCIGGSALLPSTYILGVLSSNHILAVSITEFNIINTRITDDIYYINVTAGNIMLNAFVSSYDTYKITGYKICGLLLNCNDKHSIFVTCYDNNCDSSLFTIINDDNLYKFNLKNHATAKYGSYCYNNSEIKIESILYEIERPPFTI